MVMNVFGAMFYVQLRVFYFSLPWALPREPAIEIVLIHCQFHIFQLEQFQVQ